MKIYIITAVVIVIIYLLYLFRYDVEWFFNALNVTYKNQKGIKDIQKQGMKRRNIKNEILDEYIKLSKKYLKDLKIDANRSFILNQDLERHLRYSRFSEKYVLELLNEILKYMNLDTEDVTLKINYVSSKYYMQYVGAYVEPQETNDREIHIYIQNDMSLDTVVSILAHESTHYLLLSNGIKLKERIQNECLTDVTTVVLGFGKFMYEGYKISNRVIYDAEFHRSIKKNSVGYLTFKDVEYAVKRYKKIG